MRTTGPGESALLLLDVVEMLTAAGVGLKFIGREDFIAMKVFAGGPMDLKDAAWDPRSRIRRATPA